HQRAAAVGAVVAARGQAAADLVPRAARQHRRLSPDRPRGAAGRHDPVEAAMTGDYLHAFDYVLAPTLVWLVWRLLAAADLFKAVVLFITVGLLLALAWVRLAAPDIAMAEAGIGAGLTGALLLDARARLEPREDDPEEPTRRGQPPTGRAG